MRGNLKPLRNNYPQYTNTGYGYTTNHVVGVRVVTVFGDNLIGRSLPPLRQQPMLMIDQLREVGLGVLLTTGCVQRQRRQHMHTRLEQLGGPVILNASLGERLVGACPVRGTQARRSTPNQQIVAACAAVASACSRGTRRKRGSAIGFGTRPSSLVTANSPWFSANGRQRDRPVWGWGYLGSGRGAAGWGPIPAEDAGKRVTNPPKSRPAKTHLRL